MIETHGIFLRKAVITVADEAGTEYEISGEFLETGSQVELTYTPAKPSIIEDFIIGYADPRASLRLAGEFKHQQNGTLYTVTVKNE